MDKRRKKRTIKIVITNLVLSFGLVALFLFFVFSSAVSSNTRFFTKNYEEKILDLKKENQDLQLKISSLKSGDRLLRLASEKGMVAVHGISYLREENLAVR